MAQRVVTQLISDLSGEEIKTGKGESIEFAYRGIAYRIDLTNKEAAGFDKAIATYLQQATKTSGRRKVTSASSKNGYVAKDVRAWAVAHGIDVPGRGRIPAGVLEAYDARR
ncbi:Lsr2 family protein [Nocardioides carbamazepini]|uniref:histone-like nucleoid-structuring protein Lsr2 n=1 Tax=Nocardioides carbamazepini TaxID=2854259 RepID=UPI00214A2ED0|nr:Lsr2 family protein [Nocardioides carbamazepini]MCR1785881.1 Lsr2 family protein [Nocardioides carbamazepini]